MTGCSCRCHSCCVPLDEWCHECAEDHEQEREDGESQAESGLIIRSNQVQG